LNETKTFIYFRIPFKIIDDLVSDDDDKLVLELPTSLKTVDWSPFPVSIVYTLEEEMECKNLSEKYKTYLGKVLQLTPHFFTKHYNLNVKTGLGCSRDINFCYAFPELLNKSMFAVSFMRFGDRVDLTESFLIFKMQMDDLHRINVSHITLQPQRETIFFPAAESIGDYRNQQALVEYSRKWMPVGNFRRSLVVQIPDSDFKSYLNQTFSILPDFTRYILKTNEWIKLNVATYEASYAGFNTIGLSYSKCSILSIIIQIGVNTRPTTFFGIIPTLFCCNPIAAQRQTFTYKQNSL